MAKKPKPIARTTADGVMVGVVEEGGRFFLVTGDDRGEISREVFDAVAAEPSIIQRDLRKTTQKGRACVGLAQTHRRVETVLRGRERRPRVSRRRRASSRAGPSSDPAPEPSSSRLGKPGESGRLGLVP